MNQKLDSIETTDEIVAKAAPLRERRERADRAAWQARLDALKASAVENRKRTV